MPDKDELLALFYDLEYRDYSEDLDFYIQYASHLDPKKRLPILELGCGTGRVALALAEAGFKVVGVDSSEEMLAICRVRAEERGVAGKLQLMHGDMRSLAELKGGPFNLAFCALNTFAYLGSTQEQMSMLRPVHALLVQHGILILDLTPPFTHLLPPQDGEIVYQGSFAYAEGKIVHKLVSGNAHPSTQTHDVTIFYDLEAHDGSLSRTTQNLSLRWTGRYEMELLLHATGYKVEKVYGDYELGEYSDASERMIFVART